MQSSWENYVVVVADETNAFLIKFSRDISAVILELVIQWKVQSQFGVLK